MDIGIKQALNHLKQDANYLFRRLSKLENDVKEAQKDAQATLSRIEDLEWRVGKESQI